MARNYGQKKHASRREGSLLGQFLLVSVVFCFGYITASVFDYTQLFAWVQSRFLSQNISPPAISTKTNQAALPKPKFEFYTLLTNDKVATTPVQVATQPTANVGHQSPPPPVSQPTIAAAPEAPIAEITRPPVHLATTQKLPLHGALAPEVKSPLVSSGRGYLVQVASFRQLREAEKMKGALTLKGFNVKIARVSQQNLDWYRVIIGPFASHDQAQKAQMAFARTQHIMGMIRRMDA